MPIKSVEDQMLEQFEQMLNTVRAELIDVCNSAKDDLLEACERHRADIETKVISRSNELIERLLSISHQLEVDHEDIRKYIQRRFVVIMSQFDDVTAAIAEDTDVTSSAITLMESLAAQLEATAGDPAAVAQLAADIRANSSRMAAAVMANTPAVPVEPEVPVEPTVDPPVEEPPAGLTVDG
jgi:hypothetical protein